MEQKFRVEVHGGCTGHEFLSRRPAYAGNSHNGLEPTIQHLSGRERGAVRCALYLRASTAKKTRTPEGDEYLQRPEIQAERLRQLCKQRGWEIAHVYSDRASGRNEARTELQQLMADAQRGLFDVVAVTAFDRFARSVKHLVLALDEFRSLGIQFVSLREAIDTSTPMGKAMFTIVGAMAELESALISERTSAAMEYARLHGTRTGNAVGRQRRVFRRDLAMDLRRQGKSYREISATLGIPIATLHSAIQQDRGCSEKGTEEATKKGLQGKAESMGKRRSKRQPLPKGKKGQNSSDQSEAV